MPTNVAVDKTVENATSTSLTSNGPEGVWSLSTGEPKVDGAVHWHFESGLAGIRGTVTIKNAGDTVVITDLITCCHVYVKGSTTTVRGTRVQD